MAIKRKDLQICKQIFRSTVVTPEEIRQIKLNPSLPLQNLNDDQILFYDIETDHQFPQYCSINLIGVKYGFNGMGINFRDPKSVEADKFRRKLADPNVIKVGFNNCNFDDIALLRHGYCINPVGRHDGYLMMKAIAPRIASYSLKYINWFYFNDPHFPEMEVRRWLKKTLMEWKDVPDFLMKPYLQHDLTQHMRVFQLAWDVVQEKKHWDAYALDLSQGYITEEMILDGGIWVNQSKAKKVFADLQIEQAEWNNAAYQISEGEVTNANSSKQMGAYLDEQGFELALSNNGEFAVRKSDLVELRELDPVAECSFQVRRINGIVGQVANYIEASDDFPDDGGWIPYAISISSARTRRFLSGSKYKINFQNSPKEVKEIQRVPPGWLGVWIDSTQVENVVHIYESEDWERLESYRDDPDWNEYVWLCNKIKGEDRDKAYWNSIPSPQIPHWSVYKQFKTAKLGLNFGMGPRKFAKTVGLDIKLAYDSFDMIHEACPAIHRLQNKVEKLIKQNGFVQDVFGHIYSGKASAAYKVVAYLIQGCGTGSLPKAQLRANYQTVHQFDRGTTKNGLVCGTTHDESAIRLRLSLGYDRILKILTESMFNMTKRFEHKFEGIPLRAKMYLSRTEYNEDKIDITTTEGKEKLKFLCNT